MRKVLQVLLVVLVVAAMAPLAVADPYTNLITNGTFATTATFNSYGYTTLQAGSTDLSGWTIGGNSIDVISTLWQASPGGGNSVDLSGNAAGLTSQLVSTDPAALFTISFYLSINPYAASAQTVQVSWGSQSFTYTVNAGTSSLSNMNWQLITISNLTASTNPTSLSFASLGSGSSGPVIAGVSVVDPPVQNNFRPVPEPASMVLFGTGLIGIAGLVRRMIR